MHAFGSSSSHQLVTCAAPLQEICKAAIKIVDFSVLEGTRSLERQKELHEEGRSKLDGSLKKSKHQSSPSRAVDLMPYPGIIRGVSVWDEPRRFHVLAGIILGVAHSLDISIRWGGDWDGDFSFSDQVFNDLPHFELRGTL